MRALQPGEGLGQGQVGLAVLVEMGVKGGGDGAGGGDADAVSHGEHGGQAEFADEPPGERAEAVLGQGALAGRDEGEVRQARQAAQAVEQVGGGGGGASLIFWEEKDGFPALVNRAVADQVQECVGRGGQGGAQGIKAGIGQDVAGNITEGSLNAGSRGGDIEGGEFVIAGEQLQPGDKQQGAQVAASEGGEVGRCGRGYREREGRVLLAGEAAPAAIERRGQAVPVESAQVGGFDGEQHAQGFAACQPFAEGVADFVHEQGLAESGAVGELVVLQFGESWDVEIEHPFAAQGQESARAGQGGDDRVAAVGSALEG